MGQSIAFLGNEILEFFVGVFETLDPLDQISIFSCSPFFRRLLTSRKRRFNSFWAYVGYPGKNTSEICRAVRLAKGTETLEIHTRCRTKITCI